MRLVINNSISSIHHGIRLHTSLIQGATTEKSVGNGYAPRKSSSEEKSERQCSVFAMMVMKFGYGVYLTSRYERAAHYAFKILSESARKYNVQ